MAYPATNSNDASKLLIDVSNQVHEVVNGTAEETVTTESGEIPTLRKAITDNFYFTQTNLPWNEGGDEAVFNQLREFNGEYYYAPLATASNPISMGVTPIGDPSWKQLDIPLTDLVTDAYNSKVDAENAVTSAEAAASTVGYQGLWPDTGGSAEKGDTYQTQVDGVPTGEYYTALQNTSVDPVGDNVNWKVNVNTGYISSVAGLPWLEGDIALAGEIRVYNGIKYKNESGIDVVMGATPSLDFVEFSVGNVKLNSINDFEGQKAPYVELISFNVITAPEQLYYGSGVFYFDETMPKSKHDGARVISNTVPKLSSQAARADWFDGVGETDVGGTGCYVRVDYKFNESKSEWFGCSPFASPFVNATAIQRSLDALDVTFVGEGNGAEWEMIPSGVIDITGYKITVSGLDLTIRNKGQLVGNIADALVDFVSAQQIDVYSPNWWNKNVGSAARTLRHTDSYSINFHGGRLIMNKDLTSTGYTLEQQGNAINYYGTTFRWGYRNLLVKNGSNRVANNFYGCSFDKCIKGQLEFEQTSNVLSAHIFHGGYIEMQTESDGDTQSVLCKITNRPIVQLNGTYLSVRASNRLFEFNGTVANAENIELNDCLLNNIGTGADAFLIRNNTGLDKPLMTINNYKVEPNSNPIQIPNNAYVIGDESSKIPLVNGHFVSDLSGWSTSANVIHGNIDEISPLSIGYAETSLDSANLTQTFKTEPGARYRLRAYAKNAATSANVDVRRVSDLNVYQTESVTGTNVEFVELCFTTTDTRTQVRLRQSGAGSCQFSSVMIERLL